MLHCFYILLIVTYTHTFYTAVTDLNAITTSYITYRKDTMQLRPAITSHMALSRLMIVSLEAKKKQAVCNKQVSYLHLASL